jgi:hypothetical protein
LPNNGDCDREARSFARAGYDFDPVLKETAQAINDGEPEPKPAPLFTIVLADTPELDKDLLVLIGRNSDS